MTNLGQAGHNFSPNNAVRKNICLVNDKNKTITIPEPGKDTNGYSIFLPITHLSHIFQLSGRLMHQRLNLIVYSFTIVEQACICLWKNIVSLVLKSTQHLEKGSQSYSKDRSYSC